MAKTVPCALVEARPEPAAAPRSKAALRASLIAQRKAIPDDERVAAAIAVAHHLAAWVPFATAKLVGSYAPMGAEIAPPQLADPSLPVLAPPGFAPHPSSSLDLLLMPVVGVTLTGIRLGRGGGWYDRLLEGLPRRPLLVAIAYDFQVIEAVLADPWDVAIDAICTPTRLVMTGASGLTATSA